MATSQPPTPNPPTHCRTQPVCPSCRQEWRDCPPVGGSKGGLQTTGAGSGRQPVWLWCYSQRGPVSPSASRLCSAHPHGIPMASSLSASEIPTRTHTRACVGMKMMPPAAHPPSPPQGHAGNGVAQRWSNNGCGRRQRERFAPALYSLQQNGPGPHERSVIRCSGTRARGAQSCGPLPSTPGAAALISPAKCVCVCVCVLTSAVPSLLVFRRH